MTQHPTPPAGWYPDPSGSGRIRWFDGSSWTAHLQDAPVAGCVPVPPGGSTAARVGSAVAGPAHDSHPDAHDARRKPWVARHKFLTGAAAAIALAAVASIATDGGGSPAEAEDVPAVVQTDDAPTEDLADDAAQADDENDGQGEAPAAETETVAQQNAREAAAGYLEYMAFSRSGLIDQLMYERFSAADAEHGVDAQNADWNAQAVRAAESYLDTMAFSRSGLIDQLKYDGFTAAQATHGVDATGL